MSVTLSTRITWSFRGKEWVRPHSSAQWLPGPAQSPVSGLRYFQLFFFFFLISSPRFTPIYLYLNFKTASTIGRSLVHVLRLTLWLPCLTMWISKSAFIYFYDCIVTSLKHAYKPSNRTDVLTNLRSYINFTCLYSNAILSPC